MYDDYAPSTTEWMDLLSIANTYVLEKVYRRAVASIDDIDVTIDPIERVVLAKRLNVKKWLGPAYAALCARTDPISGIEAEKLGIYTFVALVAARESLHREFMAAKDRATPVSQGLRCCGYAPFQLNDGTDGAKTCPGCYKIVIPGPGIQPAFINDNRRCCNYEPSKWGTQVNGGQICPECDGIVLPALVTANLRCCGNTPSKFSNTDGAKVCPKCQQTVIPRPGQFTFTNDNRRCCNNPPSAWKSQSDGSQICPSCNGTVLPPSGSHLERALVHVKRVFDLEDAPKKEPKPNSKVETHKTKKKVY